ncbi:hypothetical protein KDC22_18605 [Paenibacillus tritici]|uniref:hypothetical protein n=1 Tax=Paenibacillus tritici TaxID=1873425 RepID=UPI001BA4A4A1|nr:hypothetical protein [Paenibacillus tritici]QUL52465.1 hypothetical protein KDC22_18605 [Paenibacillus tritici]
MKNRYKAIITIVLVLVLACSQAGAVGRGGVPADETKERIMEQYGLDVPAPAGADWGNIDVGISGVDEFVLRVCRFMVNPLVFIIREIV